MRPPADHSANVGHQRLVDEGHVDHRQQGPCNQQRQRDQEQLGPVDVPDLRRANIGQSVDQTACIPDHPDLHRRDDGGEADDQNSDLSEGTQIFQQEWDQFARNGAASAVICIGVDEFFKEGEHGSALSGGKNS